jgi:hypothetical protein
LEANRRAFDLEALIRKLSGHGATAFRGSAQLPKRGIRDVPPEKRAQLERDASKGVNRIEFSRRGTDRHADVRLGDDPQVDLDPMAADVFEVLMMDCGESNDDFVGWKALSQVRGLLVTDYHRSATQGAVRASISRIREALCARRANFCLVEHDPARGGRIRLRKKGGAVIRGETT